MASPKRAVAIPHPFCTPQTTPIGNSENVSRPVSPLSETATGLSVFKQGLLINQAATLLSALTSRFSNNRVNNTKQHLVAYLTEIIKRAKCSKKIVLLSIFYFHKLYTYKLDSITNLPEFSRCSKRIFLCCLILAHKFLNDQTFSMASWQRISGLPCKDLSTMERWCLANLDYELFTTETELTTWCDKHIYNKIVDTGKVAKKRLRELEVTASPLLAKRARTSIEIISK
ncbi:LAFA_0G16754g1_1 [Lachancea sp. 'fantastica']|nr:LAFA_0G16754g1_1 [Lachancea sp. 'fantastica']